MGDKVSSEANPHRDGRTEQAHQTGEGTQEDAKQVEVGMVVEADEGDLGQEDISEARLKARPVTTLCIDCKIEQEKNEKLR